jgi:hypothetical protein
MYRINPSIYFVEIRYGRLSVISVSLFSLNLKELAGNLCACYGARPFSIVKYCIEKYFAVMETHSPPSSLVQGAMQRCHMPAWNFILSTFHFWWISQFCFTVDSVVIHFLRTMLFVSFRSYISSLLIKTRGCIDCCFFMLSMKVPSI